MIMKLKRLASLLNKRGLEEESSEVALMGGSVEKINDGPPGSEGSTLLDPLREAGSESIEKDLILSVKSKSEKAVRRLQKALVKAGFDLPRFGVDGKFGRETKSAVIAFQEKAAADGAYSGQINGEMTAEALLILLSYEKEAASLGDKPTSVLHKKEPASLGASGPSGSVLYVGDSQMKGPLGNALMGAAGSGKRLSQTGTTASFWANDPTLIREIGKKPSKIVISLNGNGISGTEDLIELIRSNVPSATRVIWTGTPPPIRRSKSWSKAVTSDEGFGSAYDDRHKKNETVRVMVEAQGWTFINPYDHIKYEKPMIIGDRTFVSGYTCDSCDGIHLPAEVSDIYVSNIESLLS
jgi:hypothetical protein